MERSPQLKTGEGVRLRRKIELLRPPLLAAGQRLVSHPRIGDLYPEYLITMHWIVRGSVPLMEAAHARADALAESDPVATGLATYLAEHIPEEMDHDEWTLSDLAVLGRERSSVLARPPSPTVAGLVGAQYYWIFHFHPVAILGYIAVLEGYPPPMALVEDLIARTGHSPQAFRTLRAHAEFDEDHRAALDELLDALPLTSQQAAVMGLSAMHSAHALARAIDEIIDRSGGESRHV